MGGPGAYGGQPPQYQQPQYQQPQHQQPQHQQYQQPQHQQPQHQQYQQPSAAMAIVEDDPRSNVTMIAGLVLALIVVLGLGGYFVFGPGFGDKDGETADDTAVAPEVALGGLRLELAPVDALVKIDGKEHPGGSPRVISDLSVGTHTVEISKADFLPLTQEVTISAGQPISLPLQLQARNVALAIKVDPPAAAITLLAADKPTEIGSGAASHEHKLEREPGVDYTIKAVAEGFEDLSMPVVFTGAATQDISISLVKKTVEEPEPKAKPAASKTVKKTPAPVKAKTAELKIGVAPGAPPADVYIDNKKQSGRTPVFVKVAPGSHTVKWKWDDGKTDTQKVSVGDNESKLLKGNK